MKKNSARPSFRHAGNFVAAIVAGLFLAWLANAVPEKGREKPMSTTAAEFTTLMKRVSDGWTLQDTEMALSAFAEDALYTEPPNLQIYHGADELRVFFNRVAPGATMIWHHLWYDEVSGFGAGEYSFRNGGRTTAVHGVAVVHIVDGKITIWREYQRRGEIDFNEFHNPDTKDWETTVDDLYTPSASPKQP